MKIHYVTGSRADFGLMEATLKAIDTAPQLDLQVVITGQHTVESYGNTAAVVKDCGLSVACEISVSLSGAGGGEMALALAAEIEGMVRFWSQNPPELVLVLGDRGEMLAAALAATHLGIHVGHIHGGELSGTLDESLRHAISKLSHFHFVATEDARERLLKMGEAPDHIWCVGAPGLVGLTKGVSKTPNWMESTFGIDQAGHQILLAFHPVVQEATQAAAQIETLMTFLISKDCGGIIMRPNSDAGGEGINRYLDNLDFGNRFRLQTHLSRETYRSVLANIDLLVGNSSSGIIESASFDIPFLNVGSRQNNRLRNTNVVDCATVEPLSLSNAFLTAVTLKGPFENKFGDGQTAQRFVSLLPNLDLRGAALSKHNSY